MPRGRRKKEDSNLILVSLPENLDKDTVAITRDLAKEQICSSVFSKWTLVQQKLFIVLIMHIDWRNKMQSNVVEMSISKICELLDYNYKNMRVASKKIKTAFEGMVSNSFVRLKDPYSPKFYSGNLFINVYGNSDVIYLTINPDFLPHFENLYATKSFITMIGPKSVKFNSSFAMPLYTFFKLFNGGPNVINNHTFTTKELKDKFGLPPEAYMTLRTYEPDTDFLNKIQDERNSFQSLDEEIRESVETNYNSYITEELAKRGYRFDRYGFEKKTLEVALKEINEKAEEIRIIPAADGKLYTKVKDNRTGKIIGYTIQYIILDEETIKKNREFKLKEQHEKQKEA